MTLVDSSALLASFLTTASAATDGDVLARAAHDGPLANYGPLRVGIYAADPEGTTLHLLGHSGGNEVRQAYAALPVTGTTPHARVFTTGVELHLTLDEAADAYPLLAMAAGLYAGRERQLVLSFLLLRHAGKPVGVLGLLLSAPLPQDWASRSTLDAVTAVMGLWCAAHRSETQPRGTARVLALTDRQQDILRLARAGLTNAQVAGQLGFAESTVKSDLTSLYRLTGATSRQDLLDRTRDLT